MVKIGIWVSWNCLVPDILITKPELWRSLHWKRVPNYVHCWTILKCCKRDGRPKVLEQMKLFEVSDWRVAGQENHALIIRLFKPELLKGQESSIVHLTTRKYEFVLRFCSIAEHTKRVKKNGFAAGARYSEHSDPKAHARIWNFQCKVWRRSPVRQEQDCSAKYRINSRCTCTVHWMLWHSRF